MSTLKRMICVTCSILLMVSMLAACGDDYENSKKLKKPTDSKESVSDISQPTVSIGGTLDGSSNNATEGNNSLSASSTSRPSASANQGNNGSYNSNSNHNNSTTPSYSDKWASFDPYASIPQSSKGRTVRFATWIDHTTTEGATALANFYNDTGINVELYMVRQSGYVNILMTKMASGDRPDVFVSNEGDGCFPMTLQIAAPINKVSTVNLDEPIWDKTLLKTGTIDGNVYLVNTVDTPWSGSNMVFYNKALFEENGFKTPEEYYKEGNWTWNTLLKCAKDIKALGPNYKGVMLDSYILTDSLGTSFVKYDYKTATFSSGIKDQSLLTGYQWYADARSQGLLDGTIDSFRNYKCGIIIKGPYGLKTTGYFMDMNHEDVGYTYLPSMEEGSTARISSIHRMYGIIDGAPNADAAGYFIRYWLDPHNYDLNHTFISSKAVSFYYSLINQTADNKYFCFDKPCANLIGEDVSAFWGPAKKASYSGVKSALNSVSGKVDTAVAAANKLIKDKLNADKRVYG